MSPPQPRRMDPKIWRACAGTAVQIAKLHSRVYYFPQGHVEHTCPSPHNLPPLLCHRPVIPCRVSALDLLADPHTDEAFAKLLLTPLADHRLQDLPDDLGDNDNGDRVVSFSKTLTPSDANNGGGFSVPRGCADSVFPALNFQADPPVQNLFITDVQGVTWKFRHIYRGTPRRHLFTTGWATFVNSKKLVAGDTVIFMKNTSGDIFVGIRRDMKFAAAAAARAAAREEVEEHRNAEKEGFSRSGKRGNVTAKAVAEAAELAARNAAFEVVYYPKAGGWDFVVDAKIVQEAMKIAWVPGMRVKIAVETDDSSRMTSFQGTVSSVSAPHNSPWRMLQVEWDEPGVLKNAKRVSPWEVELVSSTPAILAVFPPTKRFRAAEGSGLLSDHREGGDPFFHPMMANFPNTTMGYLNQTVLSYDTFPASMQGARHDLFSPSSLLNDNNSFMHMGSTSSSAANDSMPGLRTMSTELNIGNSQSDDTSPHSHISMNSFGTEFAAAHNGNTTKAGSGSIRLFGKTIHPVKSDLNDSGCLGDNGCKDSNETEGTDS